MVGAAASAAAMSAAAFVPPPVRTNPTCLNRSISTAFDTTEEVVDALEGLARRDEALARPIERRPGEREGRWTHVFAQADAPAPTVPTDAADAPFPSARNALETRIAELEAKVEHLYGILGEEPPPPTL